MSTERWDDERLDRLADLIESNNRMIEALTQASAEAREERQQLFEITKNHDRLIESNSRAIEALANASAKAREDLNQHDRILESNSRIIQALANAAAEAREERQQLFQRMDQRQEEIRGLQTENRRILDILLNQQNQDNDSTDD